ncbi:MAG TPA: inosine/xanthosine triphosphatase [Thermoplasmata archaeon]|nr:inosine/xanthosine triphosphatase [Thermoplasmata archaeon]
MRIAMGGTFDLLHDGHKALLAAAFSAKPDTVLIGLTTDRFARETRSEVNPYAVRERNLRRHLESRGWTAFGIEPIDDVYGPADDLPDLDVLVVSADRAPVGKELNEARVRKGLRPLEVRPVPMVLAQDGLPIQSRRIRAGTIDPHGKRLTPLVVRVGTDNPVKVRAVRHVFADLFQRVRVRATPVSTGVPEQPIDQQAPVGAMNRARSALQDADFGVGIEAGLIWDAAVGDYLDVQYCAVVDRRGRVTLGHGPGFEYPPRVVEAVRDGRTVSDAMAELTGVREIGSKYGAIGYLTERRMDRDALTEAAVLMAMVPRIRQGLYLR